MYTDEKGCSWYKGSLHNHTTRSDGNFTPAEAADVYADKGFDFLVLADHLYQSSDNESDRLLTISGIEIHTSTGVREGHFHIVGVGMDKEIDVSNCRSNPQDAIDEIIRCGGAAILAHPAWSLNSPAMIINLENICAMEVYTTLSAKPYGVRPDSSMISDLVSAQGRLIPLVAVDDAHLYEGEQGVSYIWLKTDVLDKQHILSALKRGDFYASQGPRFSYEISHDKKSIKVRCTDAREVVFFSDALGSDRVFGKEKGDTPSINEAEYFFVSGESYVRFEITDFEGRKAWSSPISLSDI
ncbi:MAG TPA: CehA/McbA family metallohydrolase [Clostridiales bacterium]|jgi:hypothetical protein|nr:CehA/McbA family metallohydrolase [Clostridiales bacterium]